MTGTRRIFTAEFKTKVVFETAIEQNARRSRQIVLKFIIPTKAFNTPTAACRTVAWALRTDQYG